MYLFRTHVSRFLLLCMAVAALVAMAACGGNSSNSGGSTIVASGFTRRELVLNSFFGTAVILNGDNDQFWPSPISTTSNATGLVVSPNKAYSIVYSATGSVMTVITNATESVSSSVALPAGTESVAILSDNKTVVAAVRNALVTNQPTGAVVAGDITTGTVSQTIPVPLVHYISVNHAGSKVLAFADESDKAYVIDATAGTATPVADPGNVLSRPVAAVFTTDDSKAYILSCGAECGGGTPSVTVFNASDNSLGATLPVNGASVGLIDGSKLYVAGSPSNVGQLDVIDIGTFTRSQQGISIFNGYHTVMAVVEGGKLYIGSRNCTIDGDKGCLSVVDGTNVVNPSTRAPGAVTAIQPITGRNLAYITIGGEFIIFDTTTNAPRPSNQLDIVGNAAYVKQID